MVYMTASQGLHSTARRLAHSLTALALLLLLSACGGGGDSGSNGNGGTGTGGTGTGGSGGGGSTIPTPPPSVPPMISATLLTFPDGNPVIGFIQGSGNSAAQVKVADENNRPISNATVTINGTALGYVASLELYAGSLTLKSGDIVSLSVTVEGVAYTATQKQFDSFPTIYTFPTFEAPSTTTVWSTQMDNLISWSGPISEQGRSLYTVGIVDSRGVQLWPTGGSLQSITNGDSRVTVPGSILTPGNRLILVGIVGVTPISSARSGSGLAVSAFNSRALSITQFQPDPSPSPPMSQALGLHMDLAHAGRGTVTGGNPVFPSASAWTTTLDNTVSYPVIAEGKVFVLTDGRVTAGSGASLYALDETKGNVVWGPVALPFGSSTFSAHAYDHGKLFVIDWDGRLSAHDAATGTVLWAETLQQYSAFSSAPTAVNGLVYVGGLGTLYAIDERSGAIVWKANTPDGGSISAPTVASDGVYITSPCHAYKYDPLTGKQLWKYEGAYSGGGRGVPAVLASNRLHDIDSCPRLDGTSWLTRTFDAGTGELIGGFTADVLPAFSNHAGFYLSNGTLTATETASGNSLWTFTGDGHLTTAPILVDDTVVIASTSGKVYALSANAGTVAWSATTTSQISYTDESGNGTGLKGNAVGDGYLIVPAGNTLTAWRLVP